jgi:hypothetical protein
MRRKRLHPHPYLPVWFSNLFQLLYGAASLSTRHTTLDGVGLCVARNLHQHQFTSHCDKSSELSRHNLVLELEKYLCTKNHHISPST